MLLYAFCTIFFAFALASLDLLSAISGQGNLSKFTSYLSENPSLLSQAEAGNVTGEYRSLDFPAF
jgi:hypothetical protein